MCCLAAAVVAACSSVPDTAGDSSSDSPILQPDVSVAAPIFEVGDEINFVSESGVSTRVIIDAAGTDRTYRVVEADGDIWIQHYNDNSNRFLSERDDGSKRIEVTPHTFKYAFPLFVGKSWSGSFLTTVSAPDGDQRKVLERYRTAASCEVLCIEEFEAPGGRFEAFRISCELDRSDRNFSERQTYWYAPAIGSNLRNEFTRNDTGRVYDWYELYSYSRSYIATFAALPDGVESTCNGVISLSD